MSPEAIGRTIQLMLAQRRPRSFVRHAGIRAERIRSTRTARWR